MADEELNDLHLSHYGGNGRYLQTSNTGSWGGGGSRPSPLHARYGAPPAAMAPRGCYEAEDAAGPYPRTPGRSGLYYSPPGTSYTIVERPVATTAISHKSNRGFSSLPASHSHTPRTAPSSASKKRPMSPEEVLRMFGPSPGGRRAHSPPSTTSHHPHPYLIHQNTQDDLIVRTVTMVRPPDSPHGFGICVKGGKDGGMDRVGVYISRVEEGSVAERVGLRPGDSILEVNGTPFTAISHEEALKMLKSCRKLSMTVRSPQLPPQPIPLPPPTPQQPQNQWLMRQTYSWMDRNGRPVSPPPEYAKAAPPMIVTPRWSYSPRGKEKGSTRKVDLSIEPGQSLGLMIRGGLEYNLGVFITGVDKDSVADRSGLMVGDQILEVNGQSFLDVTHDEAVNQLKIHKKMSIIVRDVGKVPHSCTAYDDYAWDSYSSSAIRDEPVLGRGNPTQQMIEEKARVLLNRSELTSLAYYQEEYTARRMTIEAFLTVLQELLNTPEKHNLLTELREVVLPEDRARFDELVYRRHPNDHDRLLHRRKGDNSHAMLMSNLHDISGADFQEQLKLGRRCSVDSRMDDVNMSGYFDGLKSHLGGWTQRVKSWYWGRPLEFASKLSRSFDMKDDQDRMTDLAGNSGRLRQPDLCDPLTDDDGLMRPVVVAESEGVVRIKVHKTEKKLGVALEGGSDTKHPLARIINVHEEGAAYASGVMEVGQLILEVDGQSLEGLPHMGVAQVIADAYANRDRPEIEFLIVQAKKSNLEPKPTALIFMDT